MVGRSVVWPDQDAIRSRLTAEVDRLLRMLDCRQDIEQIWLIGSAADEQARVHTTSDIDLLVVQRTELSAVERALALRADLAPGGALDLFVYTPEEFESGGRFITQVRRHGRRLR